MFLFVSSSQTYDQQSLIPTLEKVLQHKPLEDQLAKLEIPFGDKKVSLDSKGYHGFIEFIIRKSAHFVIFGLVAVAVYLVISKVRHRYWLALLITLILASLDEYHQYLTGGRTPSIKDVLLDMSGAITFLTVFVGLKLTNKKIRRIPSEGI